MIWYCFNLQKDNHRWQHPYGCDSGLYTRGEFRPAKPRSHMGASVPATCPRRSNNERCDCGALSIFNFYSEDMSGRCDVHWKSCSDIQDSRMQLALKLQFVKKLTMVCPRLHWIRSTALSTFLFVIGPGFMSFLIFLQKCSYIELGYLLFFDLDKDFDQHAISLRVVQCDDIRCDVM